MRRILCGLFAAFALHGMLSAQTPGPQPAWLAEDMGLRVNGGRLSDILASVQKIHGFTLDISPADKELLQERITIHVCNARVDTVLKQLLASVGLAFTVIDEKTVHVFKPVTPPERIKMEMCEDRVEDLLRPYLAIPPPPFEILEVKPVSKPAKP